MNRYQLANLTNSVNGLKDNDGVGFPILEQPSDAQTFAPLYNVSSEVDFPIDHESYPMLNYINRILMEENMDENPGTFHDPLALRAAEKSLYQVLGQDYPPSPSERLPAIDKNSQSPTSSPESTGQLGTNSSADTCSTSSFDFQSILDPDNLFGKQCSSFLRDTDTLLQFKKGLEEGTKFLPTGNQLIVDLDQYALPPEEPENKEVVVDGRKDEKEHSKSSCRGKKQQDRSNSDIDAGRSNKLSAFSTNEDELAEMFDRILVFFEDFEEPCPVIDFENPTGSSNTLQRSGMLSGSKVRKTSNKKTVTGSEALDLSVLLMSCAQSVAAGDHKSANEQLKLIRQYTCSTGSAHQRLAIPFANALEARFAGIEPDFFGTMNSKLTSAAEELKAYRVYLCAPYRQIYAFFASKMIMEAASKATKLHIVDFGIHYGFQWPGLIEQLSNRAGGPPKLRITGIEIPQPGFRPAERIQQTGRRLAKYCERYSVPFEYQAIAIWNWHRVRLEELKLAKDECLAVTSQFRFRNLLEEDQSAEDKDSKDALLSLIREMNPDICLTDVVSGQFGGPFFLSRFRDALYYFSTLFDLLEHNLPRQDKYRLKFEQELLGSVVMNVIACEGSARVERPETYKQWEVRYKNAGFRLLPLNHDLMKELRNTVKEGYHSDFVFDEDGYWVLQGWKGRTITAFSCWVPAGDSCI